jgi:hypothetical protein
VFVPEQFPGLRRQIRDQVARDFKLLEDLVGQAREMAPGVRPIRPRTATSVALTAADGGNNAVAFNPFSLQIIRVVDSAGKELFLDVVSPATDIDELGRRHLAEGTVLGGLMADLGITRLVDLSPIMAGRSQRWVEAYRDLCEWATLYDLACNHEFAADTLVVRDGLLRTTIFAGDLLVRIGHLMKAAIERQTHEKVLDHYRLAMSLAGIFDRGTPCFVAVPRRMQEQVYRAGDYLRDPGDTGTRDGSGADNIGEMHFVRFGPHSGDPVWTADILAWQAADAQAVFGHLQADAAAGFPVPFYPFSLQQADAHSRVADLDVEIIADSLVSAVRDLVGPDRAHIVDALRLTTDVAARRYA